MSSILHGQPGKDNRKPRPPSVVSTRYWHKLEDKRLQCDLCLCGFVFKLDKKFDLKTDDLVQVRVKGDHKFLEKSR